MVIKQFLLLGLAALYICGRSVSPTLAEDGQKFIALTGELSWQRLRRCAIPDMWLVTTEI